MIIANYNETVKIPVNVQINASDKLHIYRDNYDYVYNYEACNDFFVQTTLDTSIFAGEWLYSLGDNLGIIAVRSDENDIKLYENSGNIVEYEG